jgi:hypothetical protein
MKLPFGCMHGKPTQAWISKWIKVSLIAVKQAWIEKSIKVSLIALNNFIVVTYCSKCHRVSLSLITVNQWNHANEKALTGGSCALECFNRQFRIRGGKGFGHGTGGGRPTWKTSHGDLWRT